VHWLDTLTRFWPHFAAGFDFLAALLASIHALLCKRDTRSATIWIATVWLIPLFGPILYLVLGVNRLRRRAVKLAIHKTYSRPVAENLGEPEHDGAEHLKHIARVVNRITSQPLLGDNQIEPLVNGDEGFPAMLAAIESAQRSITLCSYIFDNDVSGEKFVAALERAVARGVQVRVLVDAAGTRYSWPTITWRLRRTRIPFARFLPSSIFTPWRVATVNLRNHRKSLIIDGKTGFTGGMNIRHGNILGPGWNETKSGEKRPADAPSSRPADDKNAVQDLHFRVTGPVVAQLQAAFANDWMFTTEETLDGDLWFPEIKEVSGNVIARAISDGPDTDFDNLRLTLLAALAEAQTSVKILTPYFLPDSALITALNLAALRGVNVDIILPAKNNLPFVHWASRALWWQVLERGCRIWLTPPPFDHSKLVIVDDHWVLLGSANWDARSLRLNFELNVEAYGREFALEMEKVIAQKLSGAHAVTLAEIDGRTLPAKVRDALARLFSPYL
jgi:cardiolipin synthase